MRQQLNRIISDKKSIGMIIFMLVIPILDIVQIYYQDIIMCNGEIGKPSVICHIFIMLFTRTHISNDLSVVFAIIFACNSGRREYC